MIPSSSSGNSYGRPSSSASLRVPSSASRRPGSSASQRPSSVLNVRPPSSASMRPSSRLSQRAKSRSRLTPICQTLVTQITGMDNSTQHSENFNTAVEFAVQNLEATSLVNLKGSVGVDMSTMDKQIRGHVEKAKIQLRESLGQALETAYRQLKISMAHTHDLDEDIKMAHMPDHLQLLIKLAMPPDESSLRYADKYLDRVSNPPATPGLTWKDILADEPFEGEHWNYDQSDSGSSPSLSPLDSDDLQFPDDSSSSADDLQDAPSPIEPESRTAPDESNRRQRFEHRQILEELQKQQYWHKGRLDIPVDLSRPFDVGDPSTFGPSINRALARTYDKEAALNLDASEREWYIEEVHAVREVLFALQGRKNILLDWKTHKYLPSERSPKLVHLSLSSQHSILSSLGLTATVVRQLREFAAFILSQSRSTSQIPQTLQPHVHKPRVTRTLEAFADALSREIRVFDAWCAAREDDICRAQGGVSEEKVVVSLLATETAVMDQFNRPFVALREAVGKVTNVDQNQETEAWSLLSVPAAVITVRLLDSLQDSVQRHTEQEDTPTAEVLKRVFTTTVEPVWGMTHKWLKDGMGLGLMQGQGDELEEEFFIEGTGLTVGMMGMGMGLLDPEFWSEGYVLREGADDELREAKTVPAFFKHAAGPVLGAGKANGLLRALGLATSLTDQVALGTWRSFTELLTTPIPHGHQTEGQTAHENIQLALSVDTLSRLVYDELFPHCKATGSILARVLVEECGLRTHLSTIEGFYLMRRGDVMSHFQDLIFAKMDNQQGWADFHALNTVFNDVVEMNSLGATKWMEPSLMRLSYRGGKDKERSIARSIKAIDGLNAEYAIPFPLTYIFPPKVLQIYSKIFVFLLQIRRAKTVLEKILVRGDGAKHSRSEIKVFYSMRSRLSWFINALLNFLTTYVINTQVANFHSALTTAASLDEMIDLHFSHIEKLQGRCLLQPSTSALHRAILSVLDIAINFSTRFAAFAGDTSMHDISRLSISVGHRSKRLKRQRGNVIGFSQSFRSLLSFDSDSDDAEDDVDSPSFSIGATSMTSGEDDNFLSRVEAMSNELNGLVRFVRRGVESLAGGVGEAAPTFGVLAFTLEDWDS
ncbi:hypothetical protein BDN71DRAFT_1443067 [Pleurotus eryngii]|uniref:Spindle pole body component n=1 Tax=Pleurotus eryngii TaxID=5323 RepID=A0A9P6A7P8_PLEER|nr:hypothetical protein BDN71DRAFT_1443067 [Pleurotus eryngii]